MIRTALVLSIALGSAVPMSAHAQATPQTEAVATPPSASAQLEAKPAAFSFLSMPLAAGAGAAVVSVPASLALGAWLGSLSNNLLLAALPAVVVFVAVPPIAVVLAEWAVANMLTAGSAKVSPAIWATLGAQALVLAGAILLGAHATNVGDLALLTLVEAVVLPGTSWLVMRATPPTPQAAALATTAALEERFQLPRVARVRVASWSF